MSIYRVIYGPTTFRYAATDGEGGFDWYDTAKQATRVHGDAPIGIVRVDLALVAYVECALWSSTDDDGDPLDGSYGADDLAPETLESMAEDLAGFMVACADDLGDMEPTQVGHDLWLTRNRHGAGFWDRGLGERGDRLTEMAHPYGGSDLYVGDDGRLYVQ